MKKQTMSGPMSDINVTPMVDVMLVMLIIFMVITPMLSKGISVDMVRTNNPIAMQAADKDDAVLVAVTRDGKVYLKTTQMAPEALPQKVKDMLINRLDKTVFLRADSGVDQLGLLTEEQKKKTESSTTPAVGGAATPAQ